MLICKALSRISHPCFLYFLGLIVQSRVVRDNGKTGEKEGCHSQLLVSVYQDHRGVPAASLGAWLWCSSVWGLGQSPFHPLPELAPK